MDFSRIASIVGGGVVIAGTVALVHQITKGDDADETTQKLFSAYDDNEDGTIDIASEGTYEVSKDCKNPYGGPVRRDHATHDGTKLLRGVDANEDGKVGVEELLPLVKSWDTNGNGRVSLGEWRDGSHAAGAFTENVCPIGEA